MPISHWTHADGSIHRGKNSGAMMPRHGHRSSELSRRDRSAAFCRQFPRGPHAAASPAQPGRFPLACTRRVFWSRSSRRLCDFLRSLTPLAAALPQVLASLECRTSSLNFPPSRNRNLLRAAAFGRPANGRPPAFSIRPKPRRRRGLFASRSTFRSGLELHCFSEPSSRSPWQPSLLTKLSGSRQVVFASVLPLHIALRLSDLRET
jgi:hypothetical protein